MTKNIHISYITDESGNRKAVQISLEDWEIIKQEREELDAYRAMQFSLKVALNEVREIKAGKLPKKTLQSFLNE